MIKNLFRKLIRHLAFEYGRGVSLYLRTCRPDGNEWAAFQRRRGGLHSMGEHCSIQSNVWISDPGYVRLGNNVRLTGCALLGHDGSINMINRACGLALDRVGKIDIRDNVFIGHGATVLPGVTIGPNSIVAAGAVVSRDVEPDSVYGGVPARRICAFQAYVERAKAESAQYPWIGLIERRAGEFDAEMEPELKRQRVAHFYPPH